jgi:hypothetical protein
VRKKRSFLLAKSPSKTSSEFLSNSLYSNGSPFCELVVAHPANSISENRMRVEIRNIFNRPGKIFLEWIEIFASLRFNKV